MPFLQFVFLFVCWLSALATLLVFLESWFAFSGRSRFTARRASGTYGVISVFVPMHGNVAKLEGTIRSILGQSYPFIRRNSSILREWRKNSGAGDLTFPSG